MTRYYAASTKGFYDTEINPDLPGDAVEISESLYESLMLAQENGKRIQPDVHGKPVAVDPPAPTSDEIARENKTKASQLLSKTDWATKSSLADPSKSTPYLTNQQAFLDYQNQLRAIAINPPAEPVAVWPDVPKALWSA